MKGEYKIILSIIVVVIISWIIFSSTGRTIQIDGVDVIESGNGLGVVGASWTDVELTDIRTGEKFAISDFKKPVVLESFAVWCPTCKKQQDEIKKLINEGDDSIHLSINTDPNEDANQVLGHIDRYSYNWRFAIFPKEGTRSLVDEFGVGVVNAPRAPVIIVCPEGQSWLLGGGVKSASELKLEIAKC